MNINTTDIYRATKEKLHEINQYLTIEKMKLDKSFSIFLDRADLDHKKNSDWKLYKEMLTEYERIDRLLTATRYHIKHPNDRNCH